MTSHVKKILRECASYLSGDCIYDNECRIEQGERCEYFETAVLPDPCPNQKPCDKWAEQAKKERQQARLEYERDYKSV